MCKSISLLTVLLLTAAVTISVKNYSGSDDTPKPGFAVVELFTSEGCSSCPPADRLLGEIVNEARKKDQPIYALAFHVDYWDYIGWKDPFADRAFSERQRRYAQAFRAGRIYTPQMVINGEHEFVGSNRNKAETAIESELGEQAKVSVKLTKPQMTESSLKLGYELSSAPEKSVLHAAVVERDLVNHIKRGENSGRTLHHDNVVRTFKTMELHGKKSGEIIVKFPAEVNPKHSSFIVYVQDPGSMQILGAASVEL